MWQRIQTVWWALSLIVMGIFTTQDLLLFNLKGKLEAVAALRSYGVIEIPTGATIHDSYLLVILAGISIAISLVSIFIYKMRPFQIRLSILNTLILVGLSCAIAYLGYEYAEQFGGASIGIKTWLSLPLVAIVLQLMACRAVIKDEMLVRMSERIR